MMTQNSPLNNRHRSCDASFADYGPVPVAETFGELEAEYAAIRKGCALFDRPMQGTVEVTGSDRVDFLNRMLTQELRGLETGDVRRAFWLNRKGRIVADMRVVETGDRVLMDMDVTSVEGAVASLAEYVFAEDVAFADRTEEMHRLSLHGLTAGALLASLGVAAPPEGRAVWADIGGVRVLVDRHDTTGAGGIGGDGGDGGDGGSAGYELLCESSSVTALYECLVEAGEGHRLRCAGWHAWNIARIEAGTALFNIDFGTSSLPHETGVLRDRVSFTKGCYLGQEVVARMESLGHPKQILRGVRVEGDGGAPDAQPVTGSSVFDARGEKAVGVVTSSTRSPMLGDAIICFAAMKWSHAQEGTRVRVEPGVEGVVREALPFWGGQG